MGVRFPYHGGVGTSTRPVGGTTVVPVTRTVPAPPTAATARAPRRFARPAIPGMVLALIGLGATAVVGLWWRDTPAIHGFGAMLTGAGQVLGLLSGYGFVVLVALMARLPPLERGVGADRLARWHAMGGRYVISLVTGHVLGIT